jgi:hypothetical protein
MRKFTLIGAALAAGLVLQTRAFANLGIESTATNNGVAWGSVSGTTSDRLGQIGCSLSVSVAPGGSTPPMIECSAIYYTPPYSQLYCYIENPSSIWIEMVGAINSSTEAYFVVENSECTQLMIWQDSANQAAS